MQLNAPRPQMRGQRSVRQTRQDKEAPRVVRYIKGTSPLSLK